MQENLENRTTLEVKKPPCQSQNVLISSIAPKSPRDPTQPLLHPSFLPSPVPKPTDSLVILSFLLQMSQPLLSC